MGVPEDQELEDLAYPGFRAALESGFNFDPNWSVGQNKKRVQEWRDKTRTQISAPLPLPQPLSDNLPFVKMLRKTLMDSVLGAYKAHSDVSRSSALQAAVKKKIKRGAVVSDSSPSGARNVNGEFVAQSD